LESLFIIRSMFCFTLLKKAFVLIGLRQVHPVFS
jgi:hypothetical protein